MRIRLRRNNPIPAAYRPDGFEELKKTKGVKVLFAFPFDWIEKMVFNKPWLRGFFLNLVRNDCLFVEEKPPDIHAGK